MSGPKPVGSYLRVFGVGQMELPVEGYIEVPLVAHNHQVLAHFLVIKDSSNGEAIRRMKCPVLLGCNVLQLFKDLKVDPSMKDAEAWNVALQWYRFAKEPMHGKSGECNNRLGEPVQIRTGRQPTTIQPRQVQTIKCPY